MTTFYRRLPKVDYIRPQNLDEALDLLAQGSDGEYQIYAGGTDVMPKLKSRKMPTPKSLIDLKGIPGLDYIDFDAQKGLRIGALATIRAVESSRVVNEKYPILSQAAFSIASIQIRNRGTITGNICNAVPSADSAPALLVLGANVRCVNKRGERAVEMDDFFKGPGETVLAADEILTEICIPALADTVQGAYLKLSPRSRMDLAVVGVAALGAVQNGVFQNIRIGLGAVAPTPMRARKAEALLSGQKADEEHILEAAKAAAEEAKPIDDHRASAEYRKMMVEVLVKRALRQVIPH